jgi:hypothetical protein
MDRRRRHEADSGMAMLVVVPSEEGLAERTRVWLASTISFSDDN